MICPGIEGRQVRCYLLHPLQRFKNEWIFFGKMLVVWQRHHAAPSFLVQTAVIFSEKFFYCRRLIIISEKFLSLNKCRRSVLLKSSESQFEITFQHCKH